jgi:hypothetical protein
MCGGGGSFPSGKFTLLGALEAAGWCDRSSNSSFYDTGEVDHNSTCTYQIGFYETRNSSCNGSLGVFH